MPQDFDGDIHAAALLIAPNGEHLLSFSHRHNSVTVYSVDQPTGKINPIDDVLRQGKEPRFMTALPDGRFLFVANEEAITSRPSALVKMPNLLCWNIRLIPAAQVCVILHKA